MALIRRGGLPQDRILLKETDRVKVSRTFKYGAHDVTIETGEIARQADGAVLVSMGDTVVLVTAVGEKGQGEARSFFPLTVNYQEKTYAAGKIPGGFFKREGRPSEKETLTCRLIDRPIRPLFPDGYIDECQLQAWVMSHDGENDADIIACTGASAALCLTDSPFEGPVATVRIGRIVTDEGETYVLNPTQTQLQYSDLDLVLSGHSDGINMIEIGAAQVDEAGVMGAIKFGYEEGIKPILCLLHLLWQSYLRQITSHYGMIRLLRLGISHELGKDFWSIFGAAIEAPAQPRPHRRRLPAAFAPRPLRTQ